MTISKDTNINSVKKNMTISKNTNLEGTLDTNVNSVKKNINDIEIQNFDTNLSRILKLSPNVSNLINNALEISAKQDLLKKQEENELMQKGLDAFNNGEKLATNASKTSIDAYQASSDLYDFSKNFKERINSGEFDNYENEIELLRTYNQELENNTVQLISDGNLKTSDSYTLTQQILKQNTYNSLKENFLKKKSENNNFETDKMIDNFFYTETNNILENSKDVGKDIYNLFKDSHVKLQSISKDININKKYVNDKAISVLDSMFSDRTIETSKKREILKSLETPYDPKNVNVSFKSANYNKFLELQSKIDKIDAEKTFENKLNISNIKDNLDIYVNNINGENQLLNDLKFNKATDEDIINLTKELSNNKKENFQDLNLINDSLSGNKDNTVIQNDFSLLNDKRKSFVKNEVYLTMSNKKKPEDLTDVYNIKAALETKYKFGEFPDNYSVVFKNSTKNLNSETSKQLSSIINTLNNEGYSNSVIAETTGIKENDVYMLKELFNIYNTNTDTDIISSEISNLEKKKDYFTDTGFKTYLSENRELKDFYENNYKEYINDKEISNEGIQKFLNTKAKSILINNKNISSEDFENELNNALDTSYVKLDNDVYLRKNKNTDFNNINYIINNSIDNISEVLNKDSGILSKAPLIGNFFKEYDDISVDFDTEEDKLFITSESVNMNFDENTIRNFISSEKNNNLQFKNGKLYILDENKELYFKNKNDYDFSNIDNKNQVVADLKIANSNYKLNSNLHFLFDGKTSGKIKSEDSDYIYTNQEDLEDAIEKVNEYYFFIKNNNKSNLNNRDKNLISRKLNILNKYASVINGKKINFTIEEWKNK